MHARFVVLLAAALLVVSGCALKPQQLADTKKIAVISVIGNEATIDARGIFGVFSYEKADRRKNVADWRIDDMVEATVRANASPKYEIVRLNADYEAINGRINHIFDHRTALQRNASYFRTRILNMEAAVSRMDKQGADLVVVVWKEYVDDLRPYGLMTRDGMMLCGCTFHIVSAKTNKTILSKNIFFRTMESIELHDDWNEYSDAELKALRERFETLIRSEIASAVEGSGLNE